MHRSHFEVVADVDQRHWWFVGRRRILRDVLARVLPPDPGTTVIDVGCGTGANIAALADSYRCIGIDTSPDAIEFARQRFANVQFVCGQAPRDLGDGASSAGALLLMDVLEHVDDDRATLAPLVHALPPGALLLITVPADMRLWSAHDEGLMHCRRYTAATLRETWRGLPVATMALTHFCARLYPLALLQRTFGRWRSRMTAARRQGAHENNWDMRVPIAPINRLLGRTFQGESRVLCDLLAGSRHAGYPFGVSLMALLRRTEGSNDEGAKVSRGRGVNGGAPSTPRHPDTLAPRHCPLPIA